MLFFNILTQILQNFNGSKHTYNFLKEVALIHIIKRRKVKTIYCIIQIRTTKCNLQSTKILLKCMI